MVVGVTAPVRRSTVENAKVVMSTAIATGRSGKP